MKDDQKYPDCNFNPCALVMKGMAIVHRVPQLAMQESIQESIQRDVISLVGTIRVAIEAF